MSTTDPTSTPDPGGDDVSARAGQCPTDADWAAAMPPPAVLSQRQTDEEVLRLAVAVDAGRLDVAAAVDRLVLVSQYDAAEARRLLRVPVIRRRHGRIGVAIAVWVGLTGIGGVVAGTAVGDVYSVACGAGLVVIAVIWGRRQWPAATRLHMRPPRHGRPW